jgi:hypothetical protein
MQYFHGTKDSARLQLRAMALIWNFHPYGSRTKSHHPARSFLSRPEWISVSRQLASQPVDCFFHEWAKTWKTVDHKIR